MAATESGALPTSVRGDYSAVLANDHRRAVVEILAEENRSLSLRLLAGWTAAETERVPLDALPEQSIDRTEVRLHHAHLPKLDAMDIVDYDPEEGQVSPGDEIEAARRLLESFRSARKN